MAFKISAWRIQSLHCNVESTPGHEWAFIFPLLSWYLLDLNWCLHNFVLSINRQIQRNLLALKMWSFRLLHYFVLIKWSLSLFHLRNPSWWGWGDRSQLTLQATAGIYIEVPLTLGPIKFSDLDNTKWGWLRALVCKLLSPSLHLSLSFHFNLVQLFNVLLDYKVISMFPLLQLKRYFVFQDAWFVLWLL